MSATSLRLVASAPTAALRRAVFGGDDEVDEGGLRAALAASSALRRAGATSVSSPARAALQTARAAGLAPVVDPALADCAYGRWEGRPLSAVLADEPDAVQAWLADPAAAPHGGESFIDVVSRITTWLDACAGEPGHQVAVTHPVVIRAALVSVLHVPPAAFRRIDVAPLSVTRLRARGGLWTLHLPTTTSGWTTPQGNVTTHMKQAAAD
ncbi:MAG TPA: histidine phosphatase family protein [Actinoplanes sp.]|nr:histidine phosphatase family protein [Actinoplanes sp.]